MNRHHYSLYVHNCRLVFLLRRDFTQVDTFRPAEFHWKLEQVSGSSGTCSGWQRGEKLSVGVGASSSPCFLLLVLKVLIGTSSFAFFVSVWLHFHKGFGFMYFKMISEAERLPGDSKVHFMEAHN